MSDYQFPLEILTFQDPTFETLHHYARALGAVRRAFTPPQRHWSHVSLRVNASGLTTTPIPFSSHLFELALDMATQQLVIATSKGERVELPLRGQPLSRFWQELQGALNSLGIQDKMTKPDYPDAAPHYDAARVASYWRALSQIDILLKQFQGELRGATGPVQFWSHHFDLAMLWFSGRLVPGQDPNDEENADEQMNFGFSVGDDGIPEPYFYITAYPLPDGLVGSPLPNGVSWHTEGWKGALLLYKTLAASNEPDKLLLDYWRAVQKRGAELMK